jgi:hypothetical protein
MIQDKSASSRPQWSCLAVSLLLVVVPPLGVWEQPSGWSGPHFSVWPNSTASCISLAMIPGCSKPQLGHLSHHVASLLPPQTILSAGSQSNDRPQVSYTWCRAPWLPGPGLTRSTQQQHKASSNAKKSQQFIFNITGSALHSIIWYYNHKNVLKAYSN